jgi:hypothetical protein
MDLQEAVSGVESEIKREVNSVIYSAKELKERYKTKNNFIVQVYKEPKIFLKGDENVFR